MDDHGLTADQVADLSGGMVSADAPGLPAAIDRAVGVIRILCGWHVWPLRSDTLRLDTHGGRWLRLPTLRLESLDELVVDDTPVDLSTVEVSDSGMLRVRDCLPDGYGRVVVSMNHGHALAPPALAGVVAQIAGRSMLAAAGGASLRVGEVSVGASVGGPSAAMSPVGSEWAIVNRYALDPEV